MKHLPTTGTHSLVTTFFSGGICHVANAAGFISPMIATGTEIILRRFRPERDTLIDGHDRLWRSEQYRLHPVLRLG